MIRNLGVLITCVSAVLFPWPLTASLALAVSLFEPFLPFAIGLLVDTLYYTPAFGSIPFFTLSGLLATALSFFVRSRLKADSIVR